MRKKWILIGCAVAIAIVIGLPLTLKNNGAEDLVEIKLPDGNIEIRQELPAELNEGIKAVKNACGLYGEALLAHILTGNHSRLFEDINQEVLRRYDYSCNQDSLSRFWIDLAILIPESAVISVFDVTPSGISEGGVTVTYYIAGPAENTMDTEAYAYDGSLWLTIMVYFGESGDIISMLPCPEVSLDSYALSLGFMKHRLNSLD